ncbi:family 43 glycosylhydrolase [Phytoactinopolyspora mesophila]|uniref:Family 43 glycosylhydrolase n=1 Tax=Phytoactinopolyspora mesophila TaxID=2650750 RepID=A0A7K3M1G6_9ACTN|nr:family 43 glycosylhydrolase [Phytoactinopolyspora mesophila]NDL57119.1 family 43 glycosylhydrolase [Phytoactinopolyspora mesophila]
MKAFANTTTARRSLTIRAAGIGLAAVMPLAVLMPVAVADEPDSRAIAQASTDQDAAPAGQIPLTGSVSLHDPTLFADDDTYYVSATNGPIRSAPSLEGPWTNLGSVPRADWTSSLPGLSGGLWAPHVQRIDDTFYFYYSTSDFGTNSSAIGLKTTRTPGDPSSYVDHGAPIVTSGEPDPDHATHNAIDPAIWPDENGDWWLVWGSHFDGIMIQQLGEDMASLVGERYMVAHRSSETFPILDPGCPFPEPACANFNRIEGPSIFERDGYFYLMAAWDWCCRPNGNDNTYKIIIGRSENIFGPYVDKNGVDLAEGGGSIILNSRAAASDVTPSGLYRAPGGPDIFVEDDVYHLIYHAYRPQNTLGIWPMSWHDGWPYLNQPDGGAYDLADREYVRLVNQDGIITDPDSLQNPVASDRCLTATAEGSETSVIQTTCDTSLGQVWEMLMGDDGFWRFRNMGGPDGEAICLTMADDSGAIGTDVVVTGCDASADLQHWYLDDAGHGFHRPVVKDANLALEVENTCEPAASYNCDGVVGTNVVGGVRRDGDHTAGNLTQAAKWPPQQWQLSRVEMTADLLLAAFDGFVADGGVVGSGPGGSPERRVAVLRHMLAEAAAQIEAGDDDAALAQLSDAQRRIHVSGSVHPSHLVSGADAARLHGLIEQLKDGLNRN